MEVLSVERDMETKKVLSNEKYLLTREMLTRKNLHVVEPGIAK